MPRLLLRPEPILGHRASPIDLDRPPSHAAARLLDGERLMVADSYRIGVRVLQALDQLMRPPPPQAPYQERQAFKRAWRKAASRLLVPIERHRVAIRDAGRIGFLEDLYPDLHTFHLPFVVAQELHGSWNRYHEGVHMPVLGHRLHPFYGTYFPTRVSHLELFGTWLSQYKGGKGRAVDVGTGCGVLALMLARRDFQEIVATDLNPNAIESVVRELKRLSPRPPIEPRLGDYFAGDTAKADLIVINPPWLHGPVEGLVEGALHFHDGFFEGFFDEAVKRIDRNGRIAIIFSTALTLMQPEVPHPIEAELERGRLRLVQKLHRKVKARQGERRTKEKVEVWELALAGG